MCICRATAALTPRTQHAQAQARRQRSRSLTMPAASRAETSSRGRGRSRADEESTEDQPPQADDGEDDDGGPPIVRASSLPLSLVSHAAPAAGLTVVSHGLLCRCAGRSSAKTDVLEGERACASRVCGGGGAWSDSAASVQFVVPGDQAFDELSRKVEEAEYGRQVPLILNGIE